MRNLIIAIGLLGLSTRLVAQSQLQLYVGGTFSKIRTHHSANATSAPLSHDLANFPSLFLPSVGLEYAYSQRFWVFSTGVSMRVMGSTEALLHREAPWHNYYWTIPVLGGGRFQTWKATTFDLKGGLAMAFRQGGGGYFNDRTYWGDVALILDVQVQWKRFGGGIRGYWGLIPFQKFGEYQYRHTALTTYLSYTLYDHAKAKARRLRKRQTEDLTTY